MSPNSRQTTIPFRATKKVFNSNSVKNVPQEPGVKRTPRRSTRINATPLVELTPSSAIATLSINSPVSPKPDEECKRPVVMPCRENEIQELEDFLTENLSGRTSCSMYISGLPGTGKTAALSHVLENPKICNGYQVVFVNCTSVKSSNSIYLRIVDELNLKVKTRTEKSAVACIENYITKRKTARNQKMILLVLDEIDQLESKFQTVLYRIFEWPSLPSSRLALIGIANAVDLTDRVLPRLQALSMQPRLLHFRPYTKDQIVTILRHRMAQTDDDELFAPGALELISAKVAGQSGDLRRALDLGRRVVELSTKKNSPKKRALSCGEKTEVSRKTPRKEEKENELRKSARKNSGVVSSPLSKTERTPCKEICNPSPVKANASARKSPRKQLFSDAKSPFKAVLASPRRSPRKQLFSDTKSPFKAVLTSPRRSPPKLLFSDAKSPFKAVLTSPRRSPRKQLFAEPSNVPRKSPRKEAIHASDVMSVVKLMYGSARNLRNEESAFPLHQKLMISTLLLILTKGKNKNVSIGKLHEVYSRVCSRRGISAVDQSGFISLCRQVEMTGGVEIGKGPGKLAKITLQWDETEVSHALQDSSLLTAILSDTTVLAKK